MVGMRLWRFKYAAAMRIYVGDIQYEVVYMYMYCLSIRLHITPLYAFHALCLLILVHIMGYARRLVLPCKLLTSFSRLLWRRISVFSRPFASGRTPAGPCHYT